MRPYPHFTSRAYAAALICTARRRGLVCAQRAFQRGQDASRFRIGEAVIDGRPGALGADESRFA